MSLHAPDGSDTEDGRLELRPQFARAGETGTVPSHRLPDDSMLPATARQLVEDELLLDGRARLNLATFVTTWMEPEAHAVISLSLDRNLVDKDEYPRTAEIENRCVAMLADLWHAAPGSETPTGCSTTGSSEACMLGGMALLRRWRASGRGTGTPNLVMGSNVQVCWEKFCRYWDVEARMVDVSAEHSHLTADGAIAHCDENTIGVVAILGSTFDGSYEPVAEICAALDAHHPDVPVHVDAASGGFIAPFLDPDLEWDFRLERVQSINASGHKYGLVYPGVGWILWRDKAALPEDLVFTVDYLGGQMPTFSLTFSRPGAQVAAQYYTFLRLGFEGYRRVQQACRDTAMWLASEVGRLDAYELVSEGDELPVFAFRLAEGVEGFTVYDVSERLRGGGWIVPAYRMPEGQHDVAVLRIVVRNGFSRQLAEAVLADLRTVTDRLVAEGAPQTAADREGFHH